ncbi:MAG TPA: hypothetical protein VER03_01845 [Bryobacteraceae bacterium]|nr:hypothetical protein [Bryobacteraceae bacterium]
MVVRLGNTPQPAIAQPANGIELMKYGAYAIGLAFFLFAFARGK